MLVACSSGGEPAARDAAVKPVPAPVPADAAGGDPEVIDAAPVAPVTDPAQRLRDGRALAGKQKWKDAILALEEASAGGDLDALAELAFTAALAGDARRAEAASRAVLDRDRVSSAVRATAFYHLGRAAELRGDLDGASDAYEKSLGLDDNRAVAERLDRLAKRRPPAAPPAPPCTTPLPTADLCACLAAELAPEVTIDAPQCVASHRHGGAAWALTVVAREVAPTYLVASAGKGRARVLASLGDHEMTISRWNVLRGPGGASLVRVDARQSGRETSLICITTGTPRCLATVPLVDKVGTPAQTRRLELAIDATDERGLLHITLAEGPTNPPDLLGTHALW